MKELQRVSRVTTERGTKKRQRLSRNREREKHVAKRVEGERQVFRH